jgi:hypothetical protein
MGRRLTTVVRDLQNEARRVGRHDLAADFGRYAHDGYDPTSDRGLAVLIGRLIREAAR